MKKAEHTPGPWEATKLGTDPHKPDTYVLARILLYHWTGIGELKLSGCEPGSPENAANAHLIAAAPDLFDGCVQAMVYFLMQDDASVDDMTRSIQRNHTMQLLFPALRKARGQTSVISEAKNDD